MRENQLPKRRFLATVAAGFATVSGCQFNPTGSERTPTQNSIRLDNDTSSRVSGTLTVINGDGESVLQESYDLDPESEKEVETNLNGRSYDVDIVVSTGSGAEQMYEREWVWGGCTQGTIFVEFREDNVLVSDSCNDD